MEQRGELLHHAPGCRPPRRGPPCGTCPTAGCSPPCGVVAGEPVEVVEPERDAGPAGDRRQVDDGVGRAADRHEDPHGVLERRAGEDPGGPEVLPRHLDDPPAGRLRQAQAAGERRGNGRHARQGHAQGLGHRGHRAGGAHDHARARCEGKQLALDRLHAERVDLARAVLGPEPPAVGAGAEPHPLVAAGEHRPAVTTIAGRSALAAPISWAGMVLSQPPSSTTPSIGWPRIISSVSIAIRLRNSMVVGDRKISPSEMVGNSSGRPPACHTPALHRLGHLPQVPVAVIELAPGLGEADHGAREILPGQAHPAGEGAADEQTEVGVAVVRQAAANAGRRDGLSSIGHA